MKTFLKQLAVAGALFVGITAGASAQVLYSANSWEATGGPPNWIIGPIPEQNGWMVDPDDMPAALASHLVSGPVTLGTLTVTPATGSQMHHNLSTTTTAWTFIDLVDQFDERTEGNNVVVVSYDAFLPSTDALSEHLHGVDAYDTNIFRLGLTFFVNNGIEDPDTGDPIPAFFLVGADDDAFAAAFNPDFLRDTWHRVTMVLDYDTDRVEAYLNGEQFAVFDDTDTLLFDRTLINPGPADPETGDPLPTKIFNEADLVNFASTANPTSNFFTDNYTVLAVRGATVSGTVELDGVDSLGDAQDPVLVFAELRDENGEARTGQVTVRQVGADGAFSVRMIDVPDGDYTLCLRVPRYLSRLINVTVADGSVDVGTVTLLGGDANGDDSVDVFDLADLIEAFDAIEGDENFNPGPDYNYDDSVDVFDLDILIRNFDKIGECPP